MGKKTKAKSRKDKFYHLAKETGYRARSAFKLLQLNKKFSFLETSKVVIDLCAAPGGWLQVASQTMPVSSLIIGVDLVPIKPIPNCITLTEDITTETCRAQIKKQLHTWNADCVLNDGAPNVGKNWLHDAFTQSVLTLHALKLACDFLRKGGWFITKVFRSKDYQAMMWIFNQLFKKVHATKPQASRNESAEIFVVCQGFKAPDKIDKKFFDPKHVFEDITPQKEQITMADFDNRKLQKKKKARGYQDDLTMLYKECLVSEFLTSEEPLNILSETNTLVFDDPKILEHVSTTEDVVEACKDLKVLGKKEFRLLANWHKKMKKSKKKEEDNEEKGCEEEEESDSEVEIEKKLTELKDDEAKHLKRKKKVVTKERRKLRERMGHMAQSVNVQEDMELFTLGNIKSESQLTKLVEDNDMNAMDHADAMMMNEDEESCGYESDDEVSEAEHESSDSEHETGNKNPLIVPMEEEEQVVKRQTDLWFSKNIFSDIDLDIKDVQKISVDNKEMTEIHKKVEDQIGSAKETTSRQDNQNIKVQNKTEQKNKKKEDVQSESSSSDSDYDVSQVSNVTQKINKGDFEIVPKGAGGANNKLDASSLALGTVMAVSKKRKRDIIDDSFNRYTFEDDDLPDWFVEDEKRRQVHTYLDQHIPKNMKKMYESRNTAINVRSIKKVTEAKARKKKKLVKKMEKARKQAENVTDSQAMSNAEKASQLKNIYKKAGLLNKQKENVTYVFGRKGTGKHVRRPPGVKGRFKVVDRRMKTDLRGKNKGQKTHGRKK